MTRHVWTCRGRLTSFSSSCTPRSDTTEQKRAFFKHVANGLHDRLGVRREDVFINIVIEADENWSFGKGQPWI
ncbi:hypothetical protein ACPOL_1872 [Acidisarcina polymorpha]|uniref:Tautomerase n=2 Tax=Acidisarcina polymorpha TaxID=2211140 RepID=A0A2Z5FWS6_9BACT|nr:hypothetical protein ACPOL_1872 [Acidisarcina polymorpha]